MSMRKRRLLACMLNTPTWPWPSQEQGQHLYHDGFLRRDRDGDAYMPCSSSRRMRCRHVTASYVAVPYYAFPVRTLHTMVMWC